MNILIGFYSESGNTRKIAEALAGSLASAPDTIVDLCQIEEIHPGRWQNYDLVFIGTPAISRTAAEPVKNSFENFPPETYPVFKLALFVTYGVPDIQFYGECIKLIKNYCQKLNIEYLGEFCCQGEHRVIDRLAEKFPEKVPLAQTSIGHPDAADLQRAADFAIEVYTRALD
jgi:flavodoxin